MIGQDYGQPRSDVERVMAHWGIDRDEAQGMINAYGINQVLPPRGTGRNALSEASQIAGATQIASDIQLAGTTLGQGENAGPTIGYTEPTHVPWVGTGVGAVAGAFITKKLCKGNWLLGAIIGGVAGWFAGKWYQEQPTIISRDAFINVE